MGRSKKRAPQPVRRAKYINLEKGTYAEPVKWRMDMDYISELKSKSATGNTEATEALIWLNKFSGEYFGNHGLAKKQSKKALHNTTELRRSCFNAYNANYRDVMALGKFHYQSTDKEGVQREIDYSRPDKNDEKAVEDALIEYIDFTQTQQPHLQKTVIRRKQEHNNGQ
jgi:hypothetical protein